MPGTVLRIGTRGSPLALAQARLAADALASDEPTCASEIVVVRTTGDAVVDQPLRDFGGKGAFTSELERALLEGRIDLAIHSCKDLPVSAAGASSAALAAACFLPRADPADVLVSRHAGAFDALPRGARVGTSSPRRAAYLHHLRPDLAVVPIRGNIDTRLARLSAGQCDALVLAKAGLLRAGLFDPASMHELPLDAFVPAAGQGALVLQCRVEDRENLRRLASLDCPTTRRCVELERAVVRALHGDCRSAIGVLARPRGEGLLVLAALGTPGGVVSVRETVSGGEVMEAAAARIAARLLDARVLPRGVP